jgi:uncharacterized membrane protein YgcG
VKTSNRLLVLVAGAAGACAVAVPLVLGLSGNPSFSQRIPVRVPSAAHLVEFDDRGRVVDAGASTPAAAISTSPRRQAPRPAPVRSSRHPEPGDDRSTHAEPGDDRSTHAEPTDDRQSSSAPSDGTGSGRHGRGGRGGSDDGGSDDGGSGHSGRHGDA